MEIKTDSAVCSFVWLRGFGEKIPLTNSSSTPYSDDPPVASNYKDFVALLHTMTKTFRSSYGTDFEDNSMLLASCISKQPKAIEYMKEFGFDFTDTPKYGKYKHGITLFSFPIPAFLKRLGEERERLALK